jgi:hypothetical protein
MLWDQQDQIAAAKYFRRLVDEHKYGASLTLKEVLGADFDQSYSELLNIIPFEQSVDIDENSLGSGARGLVYKATWQCPKKIDMIADEAVAVALKMIKKESAQADKLFFREVRIFNGRFVEILIFGSLKIRTEL